MVRKTKKILSLLLALSMVVSMVCTSALAAGEEEPGSTESCEHVWGEWKETTPATCEKDGEETRTCEKCEATESRTIDMLGHDPDEGVEQENGVLYTCQREGCNFSQLVTNEDKKVIPDGPQTIAGQGTESDPYMVTLADLPELGALLKSATDTVYVKAAGNISLPNGTHIEIPSGATVDLDFNSHTLTKSDAAAAAPIENHGELTLRGEGGIAGCNRCVNNYNKLTLEGGSYTTTNTTGGTAIRNATTESVAYLNGGKVLATNYAVYNMGTMTVTGGEYESTACNHTGNWFYAFASEGTLDFQSGSVTGRQGALSINGGSADIYNGTFKTVTCSCGDASKAFYPLYVAGEDLEVSATVHGGTFTSQYYVAVHVGNNTEGDGGNRKHAALAIDGGTFTGGTNVTAAIAVDHRDDVGALSITGGKFLQNDNTKAADTISVGSEKLPITTYLDPSVQQDETGEVKPLTAENAVAQVGEGDNAKFYKSLQDAIDAAGTTASTVTLLTDTAESVTVAANQNITLDLNGKKLTNAEKQHTITNNGTLTITGTGAVDNVSHGKAAVYNDGTITLAGGTYTRSKEAGYYDEKTGSRVDGGNSWYVVRNNSGTMNIEEGATIQGTSGYSSMVSNGNNFGKATLNIKGGKLESKNYVAIQNQIGCTLNITGGTVEGTGAPYCLSLYGTTNISGTAVVNGWVQVWSYDFYAAKRENNNNPVHIQSTLNINGGTINDTQLQAVHGLSGYDPSVSVENLDLNKAYALWGTGDTKSLINITGGTVNMQNGLLTCRITNEGGTGRGIEKIDNGGAAEIRVKGGSFSTPVPAEYCAAGFVPVRNGKRYGVTAPRPITGVTLNRTTASLYSNTTPNTVTLTATVAPADTTDSKTVTWTSSNTAVATVSNGVVTAAGPGTATITATAGGYSATCTVTVTRYTSSGGGGSYRPSRPSGGGGNGGGGNVEIDDPDVPLAQLPLPFTDVKDDDWFREAVAYAYSNSLIVGITPVTFEPDTQCDRAMVATILHRIEKTPEVTFASVFTDVADGQWYSNGVEWCAGNKIVSGYGDSLFGPQDKVTREQLACMLYRYAQYKGYDVSARGDLSRYPDCGMVSGWAEEALSWAVGSGIISGSDGLLQPGNNATRAQFASILQRYNEKFSK